MTPRKLYSLKLKDNPIGTLCNSGTVGAFFPHDLGMSRGCIILENGAE